MLVVEDSCLETDIVERFAFDVVDDSFVDLVDVVLI